jgi:peptide/nickel transport system permease protein
MTAETTPWPQIEDRPPGHARAGLAEAWSLISQSRPALVGVAIVGLHIAIALLAPLVSPYLPTQMDSLATYHAPSREHLFGTDQYGRDILSRVVHGGRVAIGIALTATALAVSVGGFIGVMLAFLDGLYDEVLMRFIDAVQSIPSLLFVLVVVASVGTNPIILVLLLAFLYTPGTIRVTRAAALEFVPREFILAARARGESALSIVLRELAPNVRDVVLVEFAMRSSWMLLTVSSLSFLGFGVNPPTPDWGLMVAENRGTLAIAPWSTFFPMLAISTLVIGLNLAADGISKAMGIDRSRGAPV